MKTIALFLLSTFVAVGLSADKAVAQEAPADDSDGIPTKQSTPPANGNLEAQIADSLYQLARARLQHWNDINSQAPGTISREDVAEIKGNLAAASKDKRKNGEVDWFSMLIGMAEIQRAAANAKWNQVSALRKKNPQWRSDLDVEMARLRARLADLNLERGRLAAKGTADERQNWALLYMTIQIQELRDAVQVLEVRE